MKNYNFDNIVSFIVPEPNVPILMRINYVEAYDLSTFNPIHWGDYNSENRFSVLNNKQTYMTTSLATISEATPWRTIIDGLDSESRTATPVNQDDLDGYFVSYIIPAQPLKLLNFAKNEGAYRATGEITGSKNKSTSRKFATQMLQHCHSIDGILYRSTVNSEGLNIVLYEKCMGAFDGSSHIHTKPLVDAIKPMKEILGERLGIKFYL